MYIVFLYHLTCAAVVTSWHPYTLYLLLNIFLNKKNKLCGKRRFNGCTNRGLCRATHKKTYTKQFFVYISSLISLPVQLFLCRLSVTCCSWVSYPIHLCMRVVYCDGNVRAFSDCKQTSLCSASSSGCQRDTACICCWAPARAARRLLRARCAAIDRYLLSAGRSAANPPQTAAAVDRWDRQTDAWPFHRPCSAYYADSVDNAAKINIQCRYYRLICLARCYVNEARYTARHLNLLLWATAKCLSDESKASHMTVQLRLVVKLCICRWWKHNSSIVADTRSNAL